MAKMSQKERVIIAKKREMDAYVAYVMYSTTYEEVGKRLGVTKERVRQMCYRAERRLYFSVSKEYRDVMLFLFKEATMRGRRRKSKPPLPDDVFAGAEWLEYDIYQKHERNG